MSWSRDNEEMKVALLIRIPASKGPEVRQEIESILNEVHGNLLYAMTYTGRVRIVRENEVKR